jgi:hypothetical protein
LTRVYINAAANSAPELMQHVVQKIIDSGRYPGVAMAKISGPNVIGTRSENIVIYASAPEVQNILREVASLQRSHPEWFKTSTPQMTERVMPGVAVGEEPQVGGGQYSFGSLRADLIAEAAARATSFQDFQLRVTTLFVENQINPNAPHRNLRQGDV